MYEALSVSESFERIKSKIFPAVFRLLWKFVPQPDGVREERVEMAVY